MPIYEYKCPKCGEFEVTQRITENALKKCPTCKSKVERMLSRTSFILKGTGWYATDYAKSNGDTSKADAAKAESSKSDSSKTETKSESSKSESPGKSTAAPAANGGGTAKSSGGSDSSSASSSAKSTSSKAAD